MIDISDVSRLRTRSGRKVVQSHKGGLFISYEVEDGCWHQVFLDGNFYEDGSPSVADLIYTPPDPWESVKVPESIEARLYDSGLVCTDNILVHGHGLSKEVVSTRRLRLVPMEGEE